MLLIVARMVWGFDIAIADPEKPLDWQTLKSFIVVRRELVEVRFRVREGRGGGVEG